jgi:hypothetical protein
MIFFPNSIETANNISNGTYHRNNTKRGDDRESNKYATENRNINDSEDDNR